MHRPIAQADGGAGVYFTLEAMTYSGCPQRE